jgi:uncharacterized protein (TIGR03083 family)
LSGYPELEALEAQCGELTKLFSELGPDEWRRPTRCPPLSVLELAAHVVNVAPFWKSFLENKPEGPPTTDRVQWWRYDATAEAPKIAARAQKAAVDKSPEDVIATWDQASSDLLDAYRSEPPDRLVGRAHLAVPLADLVCVGLVEWGIHAMDLGHATLRGERIHQAAVQFVRDVLTGLLGEPLPARIGWDPRTFILTGTGRRPLSQIERHSLGRLAERFPLLT